MTTPPAEAALDFDGAPTSDDAPAALAGDFPVLTHEQWQGLVAKVLNRSRPEDRRFTGEQSEARLRTTTVDGLVIDPLYTLDSPPSRPAPLGHPGVMPFTRGSGLRRPDVPWDVRGLHDHPDADVTRKAVLTDLERGATSVWIQVGANAVAPADLPTVLSDVLLDLAPVAVSSDDDPVGAAAALRGVWRDRGLTTRQARGILGHDPIGHVARNGGTPEFGPAVEAAADCLDRYPQVRSLVVDTRIYHDAGAGDVDELACGIATGIAYLRALDDAGISPAAAFSQINFRVSATADQFLTIARLRALRRLWARVGEACGVPESDRGARQHAVTSWRMMTRDDPWVNLLRTTIATFGAAVGGAEVITVLPFDTVAGLPDDFSRRIARNTQILLAEESNIGRVIDPAGGSWYVESLTDAVASAAWSWVQEIDGSGGMAAALADGRIADRVSATRAERDRRLARRTVPLTGVSMFPNAAETPLVRIPRATATGATSGATAGATATTGAVTPRRDAQIFEDLRDRSAAHEASTGAPPTVLLACLGSRRDFGPRETFTSNFLQVAGIATPLAEGTPAQLAETARHTGTTVAFLCSSPGGYADGAVEAAAALREAGITTLYLAGRATELGEHAGIVDGVIFDGIDVVATLRDILNALDVADLATAQGADA